QHHELRSGHETPQGRARSGTEIGPPFPRARLGVHQDNALPVARGTLHEGDSRVAQRRVEHIARTDGVRPPHVVVHDRHGERCSGYESASRPAATAPTVATGTGCAARAPAMISASVTTRPPKWSVSRR